MVEEQKAEAVVESAQAEETKIVTPTIEELMNRAKQLESDLESAKREAKSHQEYGRKQREELDKQRGLDTKVSGIDTKLQIVAEELARLLDKGEEEEEELEPKPKKRRSEEYLNRLKATPTIAPQQQAFMQVAEEADGLVKSAGLDMEKSPELKNAFRLFRTGISTGFYIGDAQDALEEVKRVVTKKQEVPETEVKKELDDKEKERIALEYMKSKGLLKSDASLPSGGSNSDADFKKKWGSGDLPATKENFERARKLAS